MRTNLLITTNITLFISGLAAFAFVLHAQEVQFSQPYTYQPAQGTIALSEMIKANDLVQPAPTVKVKTKGQKQWDKNETAGKILAMNGSRPTN